MKKVKLLYILFKLMGFILGGMMGICIGHQLERLFAIITYDFFSELSLFVGGLSCTFGLILSALVTNSQYDQ